MKALHVVKHYLKSSTWSTVTHYRPVTTRQEDVFVNQMYSLLLLSQAQDICINIALFNLF